LEVLIGEPPAPGESSGGLKHAIVGQTIIVLLATVIGIPVGILAGTYLSEYGRGSKLANAIRDLSDIMMSIPSIVVGTFIYAIMVKPFGHFMGIAGSVSLAIMMIPIIVRTTDDMLSMVPPELREAAYALGATKFRVIKDVVYRAAITGIVTGVILSVARIGGETAPLLFTSFNNNFFTLNVFQPMASLTVTMYDYAMSPYKYWQDLAWAAAILLTFAVLGANVLGRLIAHYKFRK
jgi:phosphate transport system permease protein